MGGKNASLGEMTLSLTTSGVRVPDGFASTAAAYRAFVEANGIVSVLRQRIQLFRAGEASLRDTGEALRALFLNSSFPDEIAETIVDRLRSFFPRRGRRRTRHDGAVAFDSVGVDLGDMPQTRPSMMVNVASPSAAFRWLRLPAAGVGLARMEFIIASLIGIHPTALVHTERVQDAEVRRQI